MLARSFVVALACALTLAGSARRLHADEAPPAKEPAAEAPAAPAEAAPSDTHEENIVPPEPERLEGAKLIKVDAEGKSITILVAPEKGKSGRAFKRFKLMLDDKSLILVDQQPTTLEALQAGMRVDVGYFKKGKNDVVDTVVVIGKDE